MLLTLPIREIRPATPRARVVRLDLGGAAFPFLPGQAVKIAGQGHEKRRAYSLASAPEDVARDGCLELLVGLNAEGVPGPHLTLDAGALVDVEGPMGRFTLPETPGTDRFAFIAGGTGISPLRSMWRHAMLDPHARIGVLYSARTPQEFAYGDELAALAATGRITLHQTVTRVAEDMEWTGARGRIGREQLAGLVTPDTMCFICGPRALVDEVPAMLSTLGIPPAHVRIEEWG